MVELIADGERDLRCQSGTSSWGDQVVGRTVRGVLKSTTLFLSCALIPQLALCAGANGKKQPGKGVPKGFEDFIADRQMAVEEVLSWRGEVERFLDKDSQAVIERFGKPSETSEELMLYESSGSSRAMRFTTKEGRVRAAMMAPHVNEVVSIEEVIANADLFGFSGGVYKGSTKKFFRATLKDGSAMLMFAIESGRVNFEKVIFLCQEDADLLAKQLRVFAEGEN